MEDIFQEDSDYGANSYDDAAGRAAGRSSQISLVKDYLVTDIAEHPDFDADRLLNDISVLKLQKPIELTTSDRVNAVCIPGCQNMFDNTFNNGTGVRCWVAGEFFFLRNRLLKFHSLKETCKWAFTNYVDNTLPIIDHLPIMFLYL